MDRLENTSARFRRTNIIFGKHGRLGYVFSFGQSQPVILVIAFSYN